MRYLVFSLLVLTTACSSMQEKHMTILSGIWQPNKNIQKTFMVTNVTATNDAPAISSSEGKIKQALQTVLTNYQLYEERKPKYTISATITTQTSGLLLITANTKAMYLIKNIESGKTRKVETDTTYKAATKMSDLFGAAALAGAAQLAVIKGVDANTAGTTAKEIFRASGGSGVQIAGGANDQTKKIELNEAQKQSLERIAYAPEKTPLTALDGTKRLQYAIEGSIRLSFARLIEYITKEEALP